RLSRDFGTRHSPGFSQFLTAQGRTSGFAFTLGAPLLMRISLLKRGRAWVMVGLWVAGVKKQAKLLLDFIGPASLRHPMSIADHIRDKLTAEFTPNLLDVQDDSARHAGHSGATRDDGSHGETHFTVRIVSEKF